MTMKVKNDDIPWISPMLVVRDIEASLKFYADAFGFQPGMTMPDEESGAVSYADMMYKDEVAFMLMPEKCWGSPAETPVTTGTPTPVNLYVYCDDVDAHFAHAKEAGAMVLEEPVDMFWGDRVSRFQDVDGYTWSFATKVADYKLQAL